MKFLLLSPLFLLMLLGCEKQKISELPDNIYILKPIANIVDTLRAILPESRNVYLRIPELFADASQKNIILTKESNVYVTFVDQITGNKNSLCWYSYTNSQPPTKSGDINGNLLFPNITKVSEGGVLEPGYSLQLGTQKFPAGTVIGFFLVVNGWKNGTIDYSKLTHYTNFNFNEGGKQQHVLFKNAYSQSIVLGFEDGDIANNPNCDKDFNDVLFSISDNLEGFEATSFDLTNIFVR
jgi:hypothetical protein